VGGRPSRLISDEDVQVIVATATTRPEKLGIPFTHWSLRKLGHLAARGTGIGRERLRQILCTPGRSPSSARGPWKESADPDRDAKLDRIEHVTAAFPDRCFAFDQDRDALQNQLRVTSTQRRATPSPPPGERLTPSGVEGSPRLRWCGEPCAATTSLSPGCRLPP
jgi:hypothetical protein